MNSGKGTEEVSKRSRDKEGNIGKKEQRKKESEKQRQRVIKEEGKRLRVEERMKERRKCFRYELV